MITKHYHKLGQQSIKTYFLPDGKKSLGRSPLHELEEGPRSGLHLLVNINNPLLNPGPKQVKSAIDPKNHHVTYNFIE